MIIHWFQKNFKLVIICCKIIVAVLQINITKTGGVNKLVPSLGNKSKYVLHLYLPLQIKLAKIHKILKFKIHKILTG